MRIKYIYEHYGRPKIIFLEYSVTTVLRICSYKKKWEKEIEFFSLYLTVADRCWSFQVGITNSSVSDRNKLYPFCLLQSSFGSKFERCFIVWHGTFFVKFEQIYWFAYVSVKSWRIYLIHICKCFLLGLNYTIFNLSPHFKN